MSNLENLNFTSVSPYINNDKVDEICGHGKSGIDERNIYRTVVLKPVGRRRCRYDNIATSYQTRS
jgi:hypothetical protein